MGSRFSPLLQLTCRGAEHRFHLVLVARFLAVPHREVVPGGRLLANADGAALGVVQDVVFNDPALAPVRAEHPWLIRRRRGPGQAACAISNPRTVM